MDLSKTQIAIVGGGVAGLAAALAMHRFGAQVTVYEQADALTEIGAGLQISPNGVCVLRALGLLPDFHKTPRARAVSLRDYAQGREVTRLDLFRLPEDQQYLLVHRADLIEVLARAVKQAGIPVHLGAVVQDITEGSPAKITLETGDVAQADLVVAADGLHSVLRPHLNPATKSFFTGQVAWRAIVPNVTDHPFEAQVHMGPGRHMVSYPLRDGSVVNIVAVEERQAWADDGWHHQDDPENLRRAFAGFGGGAKPLLQAVEQVNLWGLHRHPFAKTWVGDGVALIGDAAHPTLPFLAQGANMALEDAWCLADCLSKAETQKDGLARYQQRRLQRVPRVIATANGNAKKFHLSNPLIRRAAHTVLSLGGRFAPDQMLHQFDWLYGFDVTRQT